MVNKIQKIREGKTVLGIELGSTRIKAVLLDDENDMLAVGSHIWENRLENGIWTYALADVWSGLQSCYTDLKKQVKNTFDVELKTIGAIGVSAMMHGYLVFNKENELLVPFRTWRNTMTKEASAQLCELFSYPIPQRWSIAHLYQSVLEDLEHVKEISFMTTLSGYVHWKLTGEKVLGIDDASGVFPIDAEKKSYFTEMVEAFDNKVADKHYPWKLKEILPRVLVAGEHAGMLTETGARLLDPTGTLKAGIPMCPPEGDGGTGMVATNSVKVRTGNVSAGTSIFSMIVLEKKLKKVHPEIDIVTTPEGNYVAMVHGNNCTSELNAWMALFQEFCDTFGIGISENRLYEGLFQKALQGDKDCGGLLAYNYISGEHITECPEGRPLFVREQESKFTLANFMRVQLDSAVAIMKIGNDILFQEEDVKVDEIWGHGGLFKTKGVGQRILASALNVPISVAKTAGEGGAWGIAILAAYMLWKKENETLTHYLGNQVFRDMEYTTIEPILSDVEGYEVFIERYKSGLSIEKEAIKKMN